MTTSRVTLGAVLGTVAAAASTVSSVFETADKAVGMANTYVSDAATKQQIRSKLGMSGFAEQTMEDMALEEASRKRKIIDLIKDPIDQQLYDNSYNRLQAVLAPKT